MFIFGFISLSINFFYKSLTEYNTKDILLIANLAIVFASIAAVIVLNSVLYNGWRHMYFIYPAFIIIAVHGFMYIYKKAKLLRFGLTSLTLIFLVFIIHQLNWIIKSHPLQNVYFNSIVGNDWRSKFDLDYWGLSNHIVVKKILSNDKRDQISICAKSYMSLEATLRILNYADKKRINIDCSGNPDYIMTNYFGTGDLNFYYYQGYQLIDEYKIFNEKIITTFKRVN
jgi:hypothetical protein